MKQRMQRHAAPWMALATVLLVLPVMGVMTGMPFSAAPLAAQQGAGFLDAVGAHYGVPRDEVGILARWGLPEGEIPVVLFFSQSAGVSADAVMALRRSGRSWTELAQRYSISAARLHVELPGGSDLGPLTRIYAEYAARPRTAWVAIEATDDEIVALVNVRFLSESLRRTPAEVLAALVRTGSPPAAWAALRGGR